MKKQPYCLTSTGIRIPRHKAKYAPLPVADSSEDLSLPLYHDDMPFPNLCLINNLHLHIESAPSSEDTQVIEAEYWEEDSHSDG